MRLTRLYVTAIAALLIAVLMAAACGSSTSVQTSQIDTDENTDSGNDIVALEQPEQASKPVPDEVVIPDPVQLDPVQPDLEQGDPCATVDGPAMLNTVPSPSLTVDGQIAPLVGFTGERFDFGSGEQDVIALLAGNGSSVRIPVDLAIRAPTGDDFIVTMNGEQLTGPGHSLQFSNESCFAFSGNAIGSDGTLSRVEFVFEIGTGDSVFKLNGNRAIVTGLLGRNTFRQVQYLLAQHPDVDTLVLQNINGSDDDRINVETGRLVREAGLTTVVPANGHIYSGGVDFFAAGVTRIVEPGGVVGVHAWCCTPDSRTADELAVNDPAHNSLIAYLQEMLGHDLGRDFYFFTIQSAPADGIHEMTDRELAQYLLTE